MIDPLLRFPIFECLFVSRLFAVTCRVPARVTSRLHVEVVRSLLLARPPFMFDIIQ